MIVEREETSGAIPIQHTMEGWYKLEAVRLDKDGREVSRRVLADWFPNLITDFGLNTVGTTATWLQLCAVGSGSNVPVNADTALQTLVASKLNTFSSTSGAQSSAPYYTFRTNVYRFAPAAGSQNLTEIGVGTNATSLFSRALIVDSGGSPLTITILVGEILDATYQFRLRPPTVDATGIVTIAGVNYDFTLRAANVTSVSVTGWIVIGTPGSLFQHREGGHFTFSGSIGAITSQPSGAGAQTVTISSAAYGNNNLYRDSTVTFGLAEGNVTGGAKSVLMFFQNAGYQVEFTPAIPKDATKSMTLTFRQSWARGP